MRNLTEIAERLSWEPDLADSLPLGQDTSYLCCAPRGGAIPPSPPSPFFLPLSAPLLVWVLAELLC